ncbi:hypothetical protein CRG98_032327 [Punica granatum]|uniref:Uncharacterized protein n=1 Tax=Punica granatum TaxID=22663 RepID=A0A2I0ITE0_PUNGR|nr:hypothetical protein CRG98_032327 [Punica granatum]
MATNTSTTFCLRSVLEKDKLSRNNFLSWYQNLKIVVTQKKKSYVLEQPLPAPPPDDAPQAEKDAYSPHVLKMIGHVETLGQLGFPLGQELATDLVLQWLPSSYTQFIMNYNMSEHNKPLGELLNMLRTAEQDISKGKLVLMVQGTKKKGKGKNKDKKAKGASKYDSGALKPKAKVTHEPRRSGRICCEPERYGFLVTQDNYILLVDNDEPTTYAKAIIGPDSDKWLEAMRSKMDSMYFG